MQRIILASQSPRRKQLLQWAEVPFDVLVMDTDESYPLGLSPVEVANYIAKNKATTVKALHGDLVPILAADTIVVLNEEVIGKPVNRDDAIHILSKLSGKKHSVITGVCILYMGSEIVFADTTEVDFYDLSMEQINFYVDNYKPYDKAGAYAIQEWIGVTGIRSINGDFYNVMGLPVSRVVKQLQKICP
jgi:septum formation protein